MQLKLDELSKVCQLVHDLCGIYLDESKGYLVESRLGRICENHNINSFSDLVDAVRKDRGELRSDVVDAISTHETLFFRDSSFFQALKFKVIPEILDRKEELKQRDIRIWSAACSTGQEAYSIAMLLKELEVGPEWNVSIIGTDISSKATEKANLGIYPAHEIKRGLDNARLFRFFQRVENQWQVVPELQKWCQFTTHNLVESSFNRGPFDLILCRNVLIYFNATTKRKVAQLLTQCLDPEGYLIVGGSESLVEFGPEYLPHSHCGGVFYQPKHQRPKFV